MLCNTACRLATRLVGSRERGVVAISRNLAVQEAASSHLPSAAAGGSRAPGEASAGRWRWASTQATQTAVEGITLNVDEKLQRLKHRIPQKRASFLLNELRQEQRDGERCELPDMKIGDAIEVTMYANKKATRTSQVRGVLLRKVNKGIDSSILLRDVINGNPVEHHIPLFSPLIQSVEVMETAFIYQGKLRGKRVRPARIYYIRDLDQKLYRITGGGGSDN
ncbi:unnamed protein product [Ectocarpus sp. 6 AP-2014]